jgi:hypothetical protein
MLMCLTERKHEPYTKVSCIGPPLRLGEEVRGGVNPVIFQHGVLDLKSDIWPSNSKGFIKAKEAKKGH